LRPFCGFWFYNSLHMMNNERSQAYIRMMSKEV
jgi:hypothetical protein